MAELFQKNIELTGMPDWTDEEHEFARALQKELMEKWRYIMEDHYEE